MTTRTDRIGGARSSLAFKAPVDLASTGNLTLSGSTQTIDGSTSVVGYRVLAKDQTTASERGIYEIKAGAWERTKDFNNGDDLTKGTRLSVKSGAVNGGREFQVTTTGTIVIGTTSLAFEQSTRDGVDSNGFRWSYSTTTADADPGAGTFRLNNATIASATAAYIDNVDSDGVTQSGWLDTLDDSTSAVRGQFRITSASDPTIYYLFNVTGSVTDGTGYRKITIAYVSGSGTLLSSDLCVLSFQRSGDAGAVSGPSASSSGWFVTWNSTGGTALSSGVASTTVLRSSDRGSTGANGVQAYDADTLKADTYDTLTAGFDSTSYSLGTFSTAGSLTLASSNPLYQHAVVSSTALALVPQTKPGTIVLEVLLSTDGGVLTSTAYTRTVGAFSTGNSDKFIASSVKSNSYSALSILPLQTT